MVVYYKVAGQSIGSHWVCTAQRRPETAACNTPS